MSNSTISAMVSKFKAMYIPTQDDKIKMTINGQLACPAQGEYRAFIDNELTAVPEELLLDIPVYRISKPVAQVVAGDIIKTTAPKTMKSGDVNPEGKYTYRLVKEIKDGNICTVSFSGSNSKITPVKDFFSGLKTVSVVVNLFGTLTGGASATGINPMMLLALKDGDTSDLLPLLMMQQGGFAGQAAGGFNPLMLLALKDGKKGGKNDLLPLLMMSQGAGATGINPMMMLALKDGDSDFSDILLMQALSQQGGLDFSTLFGGKAVATPAANDDAPAEA